MEENGNGNRWAVNIMIWTTLAVVGGIGFFARMDMIASRFEKRIQEVEAARHQDHEEMIREVRRLRSQPSTKSFEAVGPPVRKPGE
jgi:hypothetical protein